MSLPNYEIFAIRYAERDARRAEHFIGGDPHDAPMPMDYFTWIVKGGGRTIAVDTGFTEPVGWVTSITNVKLNGSGTSAWSLTTPNSLVFNSAPGSGVVITSSFSYSFLCRFLDDSEDFEQFMQNLWKVDSLKFRSVRSN